MIDQLDENRPEREGDWTISEERVALLSVLQELTVAALDLFDPKESADRFMDRVAERLNCAAALWLERDSQGSLRLAGAAGLSRASRLLELGWISDSLSMDSAEVLLPYPELLGPNIHRWLFPVPSLGSRETGVSSALLLFFEGEPQYLPLYRGMFQRLVVILGKVLQHRQLFTRTMESERRLHQQKTLLECQSEASVEGILLVSLDGQLLSHNRRFVEMWGVEKEIQSGSRDEVLRVAAQKVVDPEQFLAEIRRLDEHPGTAKRSEIYLRDGRILERYSSPIRSADGVLYGRGLYMRDITDQRRTEGERDRLFAQEQKARLQAEAAVRLRDEFLSVASHELKTPVTSLQLVVQRALRASKESEAKAVPPEAMQRSFENIERQTRRLGKLVNMMLDVSRIRAGKVELELEEVDLAALVRRVVSRFEEELSRSGSEVTVRADTPVWGRWDRSRVDQAITNLLSNAIKYGQGNLIELEASEADGRAKLMVRDHGIGIPPDRQEKIFEPFERAVSTRSYGGLGLGLHIVRTILEMMQGTIQVESELGKGTTFTVEMPLGR